MNFITIFVIFYIMWIILSGHFDIFHLTIGIICCGGVSFFAYRLWFKKNVSFKSLLKTIIQLIMYIPWLAYQIILANFHVAYLILHPKMPIEPEIIELKTFLKKDISLTTFGNSITLTPGTITCDIEQNKIYVHTLSKKAKESLMSGVMEKKIAKIYNENYIHNS